MISVIVPVYNAARYLNGAIESILAQSFSDFEVIAVDDGSTDNSWQILQRFASRDSRLRLVSRANTGIVGALNDGLSIARGEFIARMDADDISLPNRFEQQLTFMKAHPECVAVGTDVFYTDPEGNPLIRHQPAEDHERIVEQLLDGNGGAMIHPSVMFRRSAIEAVGGYEPRYQWIEDLDVFLRLSKIGRLANLRDVHLHYRQHFGSVNKVHPNREELRLELVNPRRMALGMSPLTFEAPRNQPCREPDWRRHWAYDAARGGNWRSARSNASKALVSAPFNRENWRCLKYTSSPAVRARPFPGRMNPLRKALHTVMESTGLDRHVDPYAVNAWLERRRASRFQTMTEGDGNRWIARTIAEGKPAAIGKIGDRECCALAAHLGLRQFYKYTWTAPSYGEADLHRQAGVFPPRKETYARFSELFLERLRSLDACAVWHNPGESEILARHCPGAHRMELRALEPYFFDKPWSAQLAGKRVLVIHPFAASIGLQFARREMIWQDVPGVLPGFEIELIRAPYGFAQNDFIDWFEMLRWLEVQMEEAHLREPFDVALIGCGAAGVPLAVKARELGAIGIHLGGPLQLLFGIRGERWDPRAEFHRFFNEFWIRAHPEETPVQAETVDKGGYW